MILKPVQLKQLNRLYYSTLYADAEYRRSFMSGGIFLSLNSDLCNRFNKVFLCEGIQY